MKWSSSRPVLPGWYWLRIADNNESAEIVYVTSDGTVKFAGDAVWDSVEMFFGVGQWMGPLEQPPRS